MFYRPHSNTAGFAFAGGDRRYIEAIWLERLHMKNKVFFRMGVSLDGFIAGPNASPQNPMGDGGGENLHKWAFAQKFFRENLGLGEGGETGKDNEIAEAIAKRSGAGVLGARMFK